MAKLAVLPDRGTIDIAGPDAATFLQGLVTNNIDRLLAGSAPDRAGEGATGSDAPTTPATCHAALLTPQGKILFDFFVSYLGADSGTGHNFRLECSKSVTADLLKRLTFYRLRAKVDLTDSSDRHIVAAIWNDGETSAPPMANAFADPRYPKLGLRMAVSSATSIADLAGEMGLSLVDEAAYHAHRIALAIPEGGRDFAYGETFPHDACLDQLAGVDFAKGCFVGQEVVSRMQHRGTARKRIVPVCANVALPPGGTEVTGDGHAIGTLGSVDGMRALAMLRLDRVARAMDAGHKIEAGSVPIDVLQPEWADFRVPVRATPGPAQSAASS